MINIATAKKREEGEKGFTLIELLVVVLIIGVLAAIAIPAFLGQQNQAKDAAAQSDLRNAKTAMMSYAVDNNGTYLGVSDAATTAAALGGFGYSQSGANGVAVATSDGAGAFCLQVTSESSKVFSIKDSGGTTDAAC